MSSVGDVLKAIREVLLLQKTVGDLDADARKLAADLRELAGEHGRLRDRVSRIEGFIDGAAAAAREPRGVPPQLT